MGGGRHQRRGTQRCQTGDFAIAKVGVGQSHTPANLLRLVLEHQQYRRFIVFRQILDIYRRSGIGVNLHFLGGGSLAVGVIGVQRGLTRLIGRVRQRYRGIHIIRNGKTSKRSRSRGINQGEISLIVITGLGRLHTESHIVFGSGHHAQCIFGSLTQIDDGHPIGLQCCILCLYQTMLGDPRQRDTRRGSGIQVGIHRIALRDRRGH